MSTCTPWSKFDIGGHRGLQVAAQRAIAWWELHMAPRYVGATPSLHKLKEELAELEADPTNEEEAADVFIALVIYTYRMRMKLFAAVMKKMAVNEQRQWSEPDANGEVRHL